MVTAKEMFDSLGYSCSISSDKEIVQYQKDFEDFEHRKGYESVVFNQTNKTYYIARFVNVYDGLHLTKIFSIVVVNLLLNGAIQQQLKELELI